MDTKYATLKLRVLMLGPGLRVRGGVATVERHIMRCLPSEETLVKHISTYEDGGIAAKVFAFARSFLLCAYELLANHYTLIHIHFSQRGSILRKSLLLHFLRIFRLPIVMHCHGSAFHIFYRGLPKLPSLFVRYTFSTSSALIVLSESWKSFFVDELGVQSTRVHVLPNPVEFVKRYKLPPREFTQFLFLGRLERRKGIFDILEVLANWCSQNSGCQIRLVAAGDGDIEGAKALVDSYSLQDVVTIAGWVNRTTVKELLRNSDVLLLPSYNEGLPMAVLEAMGSGLAVVGSPVGGLPELIVDDVNGLLVQPGNLVQLRRAMERMTNRDLRNRLAYAARESVKELAIPIFRTRLLEIYEKTISPT